MPVTFALPVMVALPVIVALPVMFALPDATTLPNFNVSKARLALAKSTEPADGSVAILLNKYQASSWKFLTNPVCW